jgi:nucleotide-binding universal stress UspA family protein
MKKILVPTDLTPIAELGLKLAVEIAKRAKATISLVNFTRHPFGQTFSTTGEVDVEAEKESELFALELLHANKAKLAALDARYSAEGVTITHAIVDDELKDGVDAYLHQEQVDLVVMGTSGEENAREVFTGNRTEQVIKVSRCPVLSVRDGFNIQDFNNIVLAINTIKDDQITFGLKALRHLADYFAAHIHLVHVRDRASDSKKDLNTYFTTLAQTAGFTKYSVTILEADDDAEGIIGFARNVRAGLIAVLKNSNDGIFRIFSNHFSDRLVKEVGRPVFTFNLQNA